MGGRDGYDSAEQQVLYETDYGDKTRSGKSGIYVLVYESF